MICDGGLIRRRWNLAPHCYVVVTEKLSTGQWRQQRASEQASKQLAIDDKSGALRELVVKLHRGVVGLVGLPIHTPTTGIPRLFVDAVDQGPADAFAARGQACEQILQVAHRLDRGGAAMKEIMRQSEQLAAALGNQRMHRLIRVEEARPGHRGDVARERGRPRPSVKRIVSVPQRKPSVVVLPRDETDG